MKIICEKSNLLDSINIALKAVLPKSTMPILECVYVKVRQGMIKFITSDNEMGIETVVKGEIEEEGEILINAKLFSEMVRKLPDSIVKIESDTEMNVTIQSGKALFHITGKESDEFSPLPKVEKEKSISISQFSLREMIVKTVFSISDNESNRIMTGELLEIKGDEMKVVSLDGHRISLRKIQLKTSYDPVRVIIPGKTLNELAKIITGGSEDEVRMYFTSKHALFEFDDTMVITRLIEGEYFKIEKMLSNDYETKIKVNKSQLFGCIDRATLFLREGEKKPVIINVEKESMQMKMTTAVGNMDENIDIEKEGKDILTAFNPKFLMDALKVIDDEEIYIYMINSKAPCYIKNEGETYIYFIMPVNFAH